MSKFPVSLKKIMGAGWVQEDNLHEIKAIAAILGERLSGEIKPPATIEKLMADGMNAFKLPTLANDGSEIAFGSSLNLVTTKFDKFGNVVWQVSYPDAHPDANKLDGGMWYDNVDAALWQIAADTDTSPNTNYLVKIDDATGAVTVIGSFQYDIVLQGTPAQFERDEHGSGNFTLLLPYTELVISSATGAILSGPTIRTQNGIPISGWYQTADGGLTCSRIGYTGQYGFIDLTRGGMKCRLAGERDVNRMAASSGSIMLMPWDDYVAIFYASNTGYTSSGPRFFDRTDFDRWLNDMADYLGLPQAA